MSGEHKNALFPQQICQADVPRPTAIVRKENLARGEDILKKSNESALSIVPSRLSSRFSLSIADSRRRSVDSSELVYQELSVDNELFTARVYKRNYRNGTMQYKGKSMTIPEEGDTDSILASELQESPKRCVWEANVNYLTPTSEPVRVTIAGPFLSSQHLTESIIDETSKLKYPSVRKYVGICDVKTIKRVLSSTTMRFTEWKLCLLYEACKQGRLKLTEFILNQGVWKDGYRALGNAASLCQTTPMHVAVYSSELEITRLLLEKASNMHPQHIEDGNGYRALHFACHKGSYQMIKLLIEAGSAVNPYSKVTKDQPLHLATKNATTDISVLKYLLKQMANPRAQTAEGNTPLHFVCMNNRMDMMTELLAKEYVNLEAWNVKGWTPLHVACRYGSVNLIHRLLQACSWIKRSPPSPSPLYVACIRGVLSVVEELLEWLMPIGKETWQESPLVVAVSGFNFPIVSKLLSKSYNANLSCHVTGKTILQQALSQKCFDILSLEERRLTIEQLLLYGANAGIPDHKGNNVLHHWAITALSTATEGRSSYHARLEEQRCRSLLDLLIGSGAKMEARNHHGETPLYLALRRNNAPLIRAFRAAGACEQILPMMMADSHHFPLNMVDSGENYSADYPELEVESFTQRKAGSIPRHEPPDDHPQFRDP